MKKLLFLFLMTIAACSTFAQADSTIFRAYLFNKEYKVFLKLNLYEQDVVIKDQEVFGPLAGYLSKEGTSYCWLIVSAKIQDEKHALLQLTNDYGSEDLEALLTCENDSVYTLRQLNGSALKVAGKGKYIKLPRNLELKRKKSR